MGAMCGTPATTLVMAPQPRKDMPPAVLTEFMIKKLTAYFHALDVDGDGYIEKSDLLALQDNITAYEGASLDMKAELKQAFEFYWVSEVAVDGSTKVSLDDFLATTAKSRGDPEVVATALKVMVPQMATIFFKAMDRKHDGKIDMDEFTKFHKAVGVYDSFSTRTAFKSMDLDGDGLITPQAFLTASVEFFYGEDASAGGALLWGSLEPRWFGGYFDQCF
jgi:Ca2+-binding EF-hand superfamily protein